MEIHNVKGCTAFSLNVDGKEEINMTDNERLNVIDKIYEWMKNNPQDLNYILQALTEQCGDFNVINDTPCESCGDIIYEYVLKI